MSQTSCLVSVGWFFSSSDNISRQIILVSLFILILCLAICVRPVDFLCFGLPTLRSLLIQSDISRLLYCTIEKLITICNIDVMNKIFNVFVFFFQNICSYTGISSLNLIFSCVGIQRRLKQNKCRYCNGTCHRLNRAGYRVRLPTFSPLEIIFSSRTGNCTENKTVEDKETRG